MPNMGGVSSEKMGRDSGDEIRQRRVLMARERKSNDEPADEEPVAPNPNNLGVLRERLGFTQEKFAARLGMSMGGYVKKEYGTRKLSDAFIRRVCETFGVSPDDVMTQVSADPQSQIAPIDPEKLASFVAQAKDRLAGLSEIEARNLVLALISAARMP